MVKSTNTKTLRSKGDNDLLEELKKLKVYSISKLK